MRSVALPCFALCVDYRPAGARRLACVAPGVHGTLVCPQRGIQAGRTSTVRRWVSAGSLGHTTRVCPMLARRLYPVAMLCNERRMFAAHAADALISTIKVTAWDHYTTALQHLVGALGPKHQVESTSGQARLPEHESTVHGVHKISLRC